MWTLFRMDMDGFQDGWVSRRDSTCRSHCFSASSRKSYGFTCEMSIVHLSQLSPPEVNRMLKSYATANSQSHAQVTCNCQKSIARLSHLPPPTVNRMFKSSCTVHISRGLDRAIRSHSEGWSLGPTFKPALGYTLFFYPNLATNNTINIL